MGPLETRYRTFCFDKNTAVGTAVREAQNDQKHDLDMIVWVEQKDNLE